MNLGYLVSPLLMIGGFYVFLNVVNPSFPLALIVAGLIVGFGMIFYGITLYSEGGDFRKAWEFWIDNKKEKRIYRRYFHKPGFDYPDNWNEIATMARSRDNNRCGNGGSTHNLHVHHIVPRSKGGSDQLSNLRTLCESCHKKLHPHMRD